MRRARRRQGNLPAKESTSIEDEGDVACLIEMKFKMNLCTLEAVFG